MWQISERSGGRWSSRARTEGQPTLNRVRINGDAEYSSGVIDQRLSPY